MKEQVITALKFCHTFRFIDDLIAVNNENIDKNILNIYQSWN